MKDWWKSTVIYQIYPRSFYDSNNDGIGDLAGITQKLDYLNDGSGGGLGIETIWISPFYTSPMVDFGYDIANYTDVDPIFGTLADFEELVKQAHHRGIRVMIDLVLNHTSDKHPWFIESKKDKTNPKSDWYVWHDRPEDGSLPNNWLSVFGGPAWEFCPARGQYYLHSFLKEQPDLNWENEAVRKQMAEVIRFWTKRGVDGFRLDAVDFLAYDTAFRDNPPFTDKQNSIWELGENPYFELLPIYSKNYIRQSEYMEFVRKVFDETGAASVCEIAGTPTLEGTLKVAKSHIEKGKRINMAYTFTLLSSKAADINYINNVVAKTYSILGDDWPCFSLGNHDCERLATRFNKKCENFDFSRLSLILLLTLKCTPCIYYGDEIDMTEYPIQESELQDPFGIAFWPSYKGRDGCRTPFAWNSRLPNQGFNKGAKPWLPAKSRKCLDEAQIDKSSTYYLVKQMLKIRKQFKELSVGSFKKLFCKEGVYAFEREYKGSNLLCYFNFSDEEKSFVIGEDVRQIAIEGFAKNGRIEDGKIFIPPFGVFLGKN